MKIKRKGAYNSKLKPLSTAFLHDIKLSGHRIWAKFGKNPVALDQNNCLTKILSVNSVCDLDVSPRDLTKNFKFKNCLFRATSLVKNSDIEKYVYGGYGLTDR